MLLRLEAHSDIPAESLHGRRENRGRTVRLTARRILPSGGVGEFSLNAEQQSVKVIFVPLGRLQKELGQDRQTNTIVIAEAASGKQSHQETETSTRLAGIVRAATTLEDLGLRLRPLSIPATRADGPAIECLSLEKTSTLLDEPLMNKAREAAASSELAPMPI